MRFVFGFAGIPPEFYAHIHARQQQIVLDNAEFWGRPLNEKRYTEAYAGSFVSHFADLIRHDHHSALDGTCFAVVYLTLDEASTGMFHDRLFPSTLLTPVRWVPEYGSNQTVARASNELIRLLRGRVLAAKEALKILFKEVRDRSNRTPLLLPVRNFRSDAFLGMLGAVQRGLPDSQSPQAILRQNMTSFERRHQVEHAKDKLYLFRDDRGVAFKAPGRARHAFARPSAAHPDECILSGRRRLGAPYDRAFHYDCLKKEAEPLSGLFFGCHEHETYQSGHPHLNIAPNDFVRP